jgi:hypothetical protein
VTGTRVRGKVPVRPLLPKQAPMTVLRAVVVEGVSKTEEELSGNNAWRLRPGRFLRVQP